MPEPPSGEHVNPPALRNVALVAHVDHGKTTLVDAMLRATGVFAAHQALVDRVLDSNDQERERGITILAKAASILWRGMRINLVDTPGHADFGGEVERALAMVDGVMLLVDAAEGPLPQTRYVLSKALARDLPAVVVLNKVDRSDARPEEVLDEVEQLFLDLATTPEHLVFQMVSAVARDGRTMQGVGVPGPGDDLTALLDTVLDAIPPPVGDDAAPLQALVTNLDASDYLGRLAIGRVVNGALRKGDSVALLEEEFGEGAAPLRRRLTQLMAFQGVERAEVDELHAGDLFVVAGFPEVEIGDTLADPDDPRPLPRLSVDEPVLRMTFGVNTCPAGRPGRALPHVASPPRAPGSGGARQRLDPAGGHRLARRDRGRRPGRAAARRAHRVDAPRRLRAPGEPARGDRRARSTATATSRSNGACATCPTSTSARSPRRWRPARAACSTCALATRAARSSPSRRPLVASSASARCC